MKFTAPELGTINFMLQLDGEKARVFPFSELGKALSSFKKLTECTKDDMFVEGDIEFSTEEKAMILDLMKNVSFNIGQAESALEVEKKLK